MTTGSALQGLIANVNVHWTISWHDLNISFLLNPWTLMEVMYSWRFRAAVWSNIASGVPHLSWGGVVYFIFSRLLWGNTSKGKNNLGGKKYGTIFSLAKVVEQNYPIELLNSGTMTITFAEKITFLKTS